MACFPDRFLPRAAPGCVCWPEWGRFNLLLEGNLLIPVEIIFSTHANSKAPNYPWKKNCYREEKSQMCHFYFFTSPQIFNSTVELYVESQNGWAVRDLRTHPAPLQWAGCPHQVRLPRPHLWQWAPPGMGHLLLKCLLTQGSS